jgi:23S rRNA pseudouridine2605 synthase
MKKTPEKGGDLIRLNKYIANSGVCSRRQADTLITKGEIKVNDKVVTEVGTKVSPQDKISYKGKRLKSERLQYILLNKPKDFITTTRDERNRRTVMNLVENACDERIYPVGRLDRMTTGLLLLTNDGELADKLLHPKNETAKVYKIKLNKAIKPAHVDLMLSGTELEDGSTKLDQVSIISDDKKELGVEIHSGKNRILRRIFEHYGYKVVALDRTIFGGLTKKDLPRGKWRHLSQHEIRRLRHFI